MGEEGVVRCPQTCVDQARSVWAKVIANVKERHAGLFCSGVREAVAEVELGLVPAFAVAGEGIKGRGGGLVVYRDDVDVGNSYDLLDVRHCGVEPTG